MMGAAEEIFSGMKRHGPAPDLISYNTILAGYAQVNHMMDKLQFFTSQPVLWQQLLPILPFSLQHSSQPDSGYYRVLHSELDSELGNV